MTAVTTEHPSQEALLELAFGEGSREALAETRAHVARCETCAANIAELTRTLAQLDGLARTEPGADAAALARIETSLLASFGAPWSGELSRTPPAVSAPSAANTPSPQSTPSETGAARPIATKPLRAPLWPVALVPILALVELALDPTLFADSRIAIVVLAILAAIVTAFIGWRARSFQTTLAMFSVQASLIAVLSLVGADGIGDLAARLGGVCAVVELVCAAIPLLVASVVLRRFGHTGVHAAATTAGAAAVTGAAVLHITCPSHDIAHGLVFHTLGVAVAFGLGLLIDWQRIRRASRRVS